MTARRCVLESEQRLARADLVFGHGTDNPRDEAVFLVFHVLDLPFDSSDETLDQPLKETQSAAIEAIVTERIESHRPAAYLTHRMWFAGHEFYVDERVLVPRSPIAELINNKFRPWFDADKIRRVLEIGTGSGCIAIATALALPGARVDATDISSDALVVSEINCARFPHAADRLRFINADLFPDSNDRYDLIISNPPYVPSNVVAELPREYAHEPSIALDAGPDGLKFVRRIIEAAAARLNEGGGLLIDVGEMAAAVDRDIRSVHFMWVDMEHGGDGIGIARKSDFDH